MTCPLERCQEIIGYKYKNPEFLLEALTHASCSKETGKNNERLEFLGDAILGMVISDYLFTNFPEGREGDMTQIKSFVVSRSTLARYARRIGLRECIQLGKGIASKTRLPDSVYANTFEAIFASIYLDGGIEAIREVIIRLLSSEVQAVIAKTHQPNFKSVLQQYTQRVMHTTPIYSVVEENGPDHGKIFTVIAKIKSKAFSPGKGFTKKEAEQNAAKKPLAELDIDPHDYDNGSGNNNSINKKKNSS